MVLLPGAEELPFEVLTDTGSAYPDVPIHLKMIDDTRFHLKASCKECSAHAHNGNDALPSEPFEIDAEFEFGEEIMFGKAVLRIERNAKITSLAREGAYAVEILSPAERHATLSDRFSVKRIERSSIVYELEYQGWAPERCKAFLKAFFEGCQAFELQEEFRASQNAIELIEAKIDSLKLLDPGSVEEEDFSFWLEMRAKKMIEKATIVSDLRVIDAPRSYPCGR